MKDRFRPGRERFNEVFLISPLNRRVLMIIDGNEQMRKQIELDRAGHKTEADALKMDFLKQIRESGEDFCPWESVTPEAGDLTERKEPSKAGRITGVKS